LKKTALEHNKKNIGKTTEVLIEDFKIINKENFLYGKTRNYKTIKISARKILNPKSLIGTFVKAKIVGATYWGLRGVFDAIKPEK